MSYKEQEQSASLVHYGRLLKHLSKILEDHDQLVCAREPWHDLTGGRLADEASILGRPAIHATFLKIDEVLETRPSIRRPGETDIKVKYSEFAPQSDVQRATLFKNLSITKMREEIKKGAGEFDGWQWCLRLTIRGHSRKQVTATRLKLDRLLRSIRAGEEAVNLAHGRST
jgi:hypothetical protein